MAGSARRSRQQGNLPSELTSFVGRRRELAEIKRLLTATRLLTLTGPGGGGKTRLALRAASEMARNFPDGVWLVALAPIDDPLLVPQAVFASLGLQDVTARWSLSALSEYLANRRALILLDNCEHLLDAAAGLIGTLLRSCPELRILATSRQALAMAGEVRLRVPALALPDQSSRLAAGQIAGFDAVALFQERANAVLPGFVVDDSNAGQVVDLCRRLDGIPLALELAAARLEGLTVAQLAATLNEELADPAMAMRGGEARQRTMAATLDWSHALLTEQQQRVWARLSVFAGSFDAEAAAAVCSDGESPDATVVGTLAALVERSILQRDRGAGASRYLVLETVRQFGAQKLRGLGQEVEVQRRLCDWALALARRVGTFGPDQAEMFNRAHLDRYNVWAALDFCIRQPGEAVRGAEICRHFWIYWASRGPIADARRVVASLLAATPERGSVRGHLLLTSAALAVAQADFTAIGTWSQEALAIGRELDDSEVVATALVFDATSRALAGDMAAAGELAESALGLAQPFHLQPIALSAIQVLCLVKLSTGEIDAAIELGQRGVSVSQTLGELWFRGYLYNYLAQAFWQRGDLSHAEGVAKEEAACHLALDDRQGLGIVIETLAWIASERAAYQRAATLLGSAQRLRLTVGSTLPEHFRVRHERAASLAIATLGQAQFDSAFQRGDAMALQETVAYAVEGKPMAATPLPSDAAMKGPLTRRELDIAKLVRDGLTNKEIAAKLFISNRTVETHITNMLNKLGFNSRTQLARWVE